MGCCCCWVFPVGGGGGEVISSFGIGGVKLREVQNREKAGDKQGSVFFVVVRRGKAGDVGLYVTFRV